MTLTPQMDMVLGGLYKGLIDQDENTIIECLGQVDLNDLLSQETISEVRARGRTPLTLFLCTLAISNEIDAQAAQFWLDCHHSITHRMLHDGIKRLDDTNIVRRLVEAAIHATNLQKAQVASATGSSQDWLQAFELTLDLADLVSAQLLIDTLMARPIDTLLMLKMAYILTGRNDLYVKQNELLEVDVEVDYGCLAAVYNVFIQVAQQAKLEDDAAYLSYLRTTALEAGGRYDEAVRILRSLEGQAFKIEYLADAIRCLCKAGHMQEAVKRADSLILKVTGTDIKKKDYDFKDADGRHRELPPNNFAAYASEALHDLTKIFADNNLKLFLVSGTLLGYERDGNLLAHDKDIDVGVIGWENQFEICMALQKSGGFSFSAKLLKADQAFCVPIQHKTTGVWIDIFIYYPQGDKLVTGVDFDFGHQQRFAFTPFELRAVNFLGVDMYVPDDVQRNLEENYGDWRVPDPSYIAHLESPSIVQKGNPGFMMTARVHALAAISESKPKKLRKVIDIMHSYIDHPMGMEHAVLEHLDRLCTKMETDDGAFTAGADETLTAREVVYAYA